MAEDASWGGWRNSSGSSSRGAPAASPSPSSSSSSSTSASSRRPASQRSASAMDGKEHRREHRRAAPRVSRRWSARLLQARQWAETDPAVRALLHRLTPLLIRLRDRADSVALRVWPGALFVTRLLLLLLLASLGCVTRGFQSLFSLSSAALCLSLWCAVLSLTALAGFLSVFAASMVTVVVSFFLGLIPGVVVVGLYGAVVVWMYGSFWFTAIILVFAGALIFLERGRFAGGAIVVIYSIYSCKVHGGWLGLTLCFGLSFVSSDLVVFFLTSIEERRQSEKLHERTKPGAKHHQPQTPVKPQAAFTEDVSGAPDVDQTAAEEEVARVLGCSDHYAVLGVARFEQCDEAVLKKEYRRKAMLVHPDKNKGNATAEEAFKRLQNAYEVLMDTAKRKCYDDDLRREQLIMNFRRNGFGFHQNGRCDSPDCACQHQDDAEVEMVDARPIVCRNCKQLHMWTRTDRNKQHARWCQECQEFHPAKDGDGWVEQSTQPFFFGLFQKVDLPQAYACSEGLVFNVTDWAICQGMKCPANTHKPSFYVSTGAASSQGSRGKGPSKKGNVADGFSFPDIDENMSEQEFYEWLEKAVASGLFDGINQQHHGNSSQNNNQQQQQQQQHQPQQQQQQQQQQHASGSNHNKHGRKKKKGGNRKQW